MPDRAGQAAAGVRLALTTLTVLPVRPGAVTPATAGIAMSTAGAVGAVIGVALGGAAIGLRALGAPAFLIAAIVVALLAVVTRGLHLDGLADTADALGSYRDPAAALAIMKSPEVGPFGVAAIVLALLVQTAAITSIVTRPRPQLLDALVVGAATGRIAVSWACRRGVPAARPDGLGARMAGTVPPAVPALLAVAIAVAGIWAVPHRPWQGPLAVALSLTVAAITLRHVRRRLGGITGDVLGALVEITSTIGYAVLAV